MMFKRLRVLKYNRRERHNELIVIDVDVRLYCVRSDFKMIERRLEMMNPCHEFTVLGWFGDEWKYSLDRPQPQELFQEQIS